MAVSKTFGLEAISAAYHAGQRHFGESRLQEAIPKIAALPADIVWHFIGPLQSNKAKKVAALFDVVHSFDRESQLHESVKGRLNLSGLIEVNIGSEAQKAGLPPDAKALIAFRDRMLAAGIIFEGLMTIGPEVGPEAMRPYFRRLFSLNEELGGKWLSMGMSGDFETAIEEGATHVRIGSAIFGSR